MREPAPGLQQAHVRARLLRAERFDPVVAAPGVRARELQQLFDALGGGGLARGMPGKRLRGGAARHDQQ